MEFEPGPGERAGGVGAGAQPTEPDLPFAGASFGAVIALVQVLLEERRALRERFAEIERSNADLEAFAGRAAHELRNALTPVRLGCRILTGPPPADVRTVSAMIDDSLRHAVALIDALLVFSRVGADARAGEAALGATLWAVIDELRPTIRAGEVELVVEAPDDGLLVACEPGLLHIVLANVIGNAVKFVTEVEVRRVRISTVEDGARVVLCVEDTGPGIPVEVMGRVFEPFFRMPRTGVDGHGLGLATVRRIVGSCDGSVRIQSEAGQGTRVWLELPLRGR